MLVQLYCLSSSLFLNARPKKKELDAWRNLDHSGSRPPPLPPFVPAGRHLPGAAEDAILYILYIALLLRNSSSAAQQATIAERYSVVVQGSSSRHAHPLISFLGKKFFFILFPSDCLEKIGCSA